MECTHCGLPVPAALVEPEADEQFCCNGCRTVYRVIQGYGLDRFYDLKDVSDARQAARTTDRQYREYDDPKFSELYVRPAGSGLRSVELYLEGVHCAACVWLVEKTPVLLEGVHEVRLDLGKSMARVTWDPARVNLSAVARSLDSLGYPAHPFRGVRVRDMRRKEDRALLIRIGVAGFCAGNIMLISFALYGGMFHGISDEFRNLFHWASLTISLPAVLWCAGLFYRSAWGAVRARTTHMDIPISLGILTGFLWGVFSTVTGRGEVYYDSVTLLIFLLLAGRWVQRNQQRRAADASELLYSLAPTSARLVVDGQVHESPLEAVLPGATVEVRAGDSVPVDGVVLEGNSSLNVALLSGESRPVEVQRSDRVFAGTENLASRLLVEVTGTGEDTRVGRLMKLVEEAGRRKAPVIRLADRISGWFVSTVLLLAAGTALVWWWIDPGLAVEHAVALLVVTCPCALGLATPLAVSAAIGKAARLGILIKGGDVLERLARPGRIVLDKTGTLTEGKSRLVQWIGDETVRADLAALERHSAHPVARAFVEGVEPSEEQPNAILEDARGGGIRGTVDGRHVVAGSPGYMRSRNASFPAWAEAALQEVTTAGLTPVLVSRGEEVLALAGIGDPVRQDSRSTLRRIGEAGWQVEVLSGDYPAVVHAVAADLGIDPARAHGGRQPEEKLDYIISAVAADEHAVVMVGDGINDAAALSAASVGVGVHGGAEAALSAADVFLTREGLSPVAELLDGARRTFKVIRLNLIFSLLYNLIGAVLAIAGRIDPLAAAILMPVSSLTVITLSYRANTFRRSRNR
ncbi:MAG: heavy metal translocating P-type ATPase [Acidobacteria bacterium]|uniref:Heavy metal translocating P-type ATPase n=1 Tax=Candidatus Polarisedimenticola svalbardensis TaxID=2886004 RepID=A0A8J6Y2F2_9BACT|nr:heavy metal translocating P-type ATPase [Candidatus Polarisedimenticola svalbardensis]